MTIALQIRALALLPIFHPISNRRFTSATGLLQVLSNPSEWKCAATVAIVFFVVSLALAPALTRDQQKLASEINTKTLEAAAAIRMSPRLPPRAQNSAVRR
jgi:preprotein translocase subunit SecG